jgi:glutathione synthase
MEKFMSFKLGIVMDPLPSINIKKDSSFAMMLAAQKSGWEIHTIYQADLYTENEIPRAFSRITRVDDNPDHWFDFASKQDIDLSSLDVILMRKDPPFDIEYIASTYILQLAENLGSLVVNKPASLRDNNEKMFITQFPQCCTPFLVSRNKKRLRRFISERFHEKQQDVILKPLDGMGGTSIYRVNPEDPNISVILEAVSENETRTVMAQQFLPEITHGDKRVLLIDGKAVPYALARIPASGETRGNLAAGGTGVGVELSERDHWICQQVGPVLKQQGILFAGIDIIGDYLTEINITSPTCIRELDKIYSLDIAGDLMRCIEQHLRAL